MSAGSAVSKEWAPKIADDGALVIDNASYWRMDREVPLVVPEVNARRARARHQEGHHRQPELLDGAAGGGAEAAARRRHHQARGGVDLSVRFRRRQGADGRAVPPDARGLRRRPHRERSMFTKQIAFNVIPHIEDLHGFRLHQGGIEDDGRDAEDPRSRHPAGTPPACACRCSSAIRKR